jgi:hypothetical protein
MFFFSKEAKVFPRFQPTTSTFKTCVAYPRKIIDRIPDIEKGLKKKVPQSPPTSLLATHNVNVALSVIF